METQSQLPKALSAVLYLATYENGRFISDAYFRLSKPERDLIDKWLVTIKHPLAYQPGTQESRIIALVKQYGSN